MECPSCNSYSLKPTKLDYGLPARSCAKCGGILLSLLSYRDWVETVPESLLQQGKADITAVDNEQALICKKCSRIMLKYRITAKTTNHVDICTTCDDVWLDSGEWGILKYLKLHNDLTKIFTEPWQTGIRKNIEKQNYEARFKELLGTEDYEKVRKTREWISGHEKHLDLIRYLLKKD